MRKAMDLDQEGSESKARGWGARKESSCEGADASRNAWLEDGRQAGMYVKGKSAPRGYWGMASLVARAA